jgi:hypothetical protein
MTDRPERPSTMVPPPDREKTTDRPLPTDRAPPEDLLKLSENVFTRLGEVEDAVKRLASVLAHQTAKVDELHALLHGTPRKKGGKPERNIVSALHDLTGKIAVAGANAELVAEQQKTLPQILAEAVANKVVELFQGELHAQSDRIKALEARVDELSVPGPNGRGHSR